jgi:hypothetical protein
MTVNACSAACTTHFYAAIYVFIMDHKELSGVLRSGIYGSHKNNCVVDVGATTTNPEVWVMFIQNAAHNRVSVQVLHCAVTTNLS